MTCGSTTGVISFFVRGLPKTQGSTRTWVTKAGRPVTTTTTKGLYEWRRLIADQGQVHAPPQPWDCAVSLYATFYLPKPKSAPKTRRTYPIHRPDLSKLLRAIEDALNQVAWADDSRIVNEYVEKCWAGEPNSPPNPPRPPGVMIQAWPLERFPLRGKHADIIVLDETRPESS